MSADMTPAVARAIESAQRLAARAGARTVEPIHLLQGLLEEEEGQAASLLARSGLDLESLWENWEGFVVEDASSSILESEAELGMDTFFHRAGDLAEELEGERMITTNTLVYVLIRDEPSLRKELEEFGFDGDRMEEEIMALRPPSLRLEEPLRLSAATDRIDASSRSGRWVQPRPGSLASHRGLLSICSG